MATVNPVTAATKEMKKYLCVKNSLAEEKMTSTLISIAKSCCKEEKAFVHLQLFFHLPYPDEFEQVIEEPGDFAFIVPGFVNNSPLPVKTYCDVVIEGCLLPHFFQTVLYLCDKEFMKGLTALVVEKFLGSEGHHDLYPSVLLMLGKITRQASSNLAGTDNDYLKQFKLVMEKFLKNNDAKYEKLSTLLRLFGVCCMQPEDYEGNGSDFLELLEEWSYDLTHRVASDTKNYLRDCFQDKITQAVHQQITMDLLITIQHAIMKLGVYDKETEEWKSVHKTARISWTEFIGVHAYLTHSLVTKYAESIDSSKIEQVSIILDRWAQYRPKLTRNDFQGEMADFAQFYKILKRFGDKDRDRMTLLPKLLDFSYKELYCSKDGLRIAEKYLIPGGDFETVTGYILKALDKSEMPQECRGAVPGTVKLIIQKLMCANFGANLRKNEIVAAIFKTGAHTDLILQEFSYHVNYLCSKVGTIEKEAKVVTQIEHNKDLVYSTCLQNPVAAIQALLRHSISSQHFKALSYAKPFMVIPSSLKSTISVRNFCFETIIDNAEDHDQIFNNLANSIPQLITNDLMDAEELFELLKKKITALFLSSTTSLKKISKLFFVMGSLTNVLMGQEQGGDNQECSSLVLEILRFAINTKKLTYSIVPKFTSKEMLLIRTLCTKIETTIKSGNAAAKTATISSDMDITNALKAMSLVQIGYVYIRRPEFEVQVINFFQDPAMSDKLATEFQFSNVVNSLVTWVYNSDAEEWTTILNFVVEVIGNTSGFEHDLLMLFNRSLNFAWDACHGVQYQPILRQYLKFYNNATQRLLERNLQNPESIVDTIVCVIANMQESKNRRKVYADKCVIDTTIQQVLLLLLEELNMIIGYNKNFEEELKEDVLDSLMFIPVLKGACESVRKCIIDRVLNFSESNLLPLPDVCNQANPGAGGGDIPNLEELLRQVPSSDY